MWDYLKLRHFLLLLDTELPLSRPHSAPPRPPGTYAPSRTRTSPLRIGVRASTPFSHPTYLPHTALQQLHSLETRRSRFPLHDEEGEKDRGEDTGLDHGVENGGTCLPYSFRSI